MTVEFTFENLRRWFRALQDITFDEFTEIIRSTTGTDKSYCRGVWVPFQDTTLAWMFNRNPIAQAERLFDLAMKKAGLLDKPRAAPEPLNIMLDGPLPPPGHPLISDHPYVRDETRPDRCARCGCVGSYHQREE